MQKKMPLRGQLLKRDSMSVDGSNSALFEELMSDISPEAEAKLREGLIEQLRKAGCSEATLELMRNPQPFPPRESNS
jgi:hypothetical protein